MIALIQRVTQARVRVNSAVVAEIGGGLLALICAQRDDAEHEAEKLLSKLLDYRVFADAAGRMNRSLREAGGSLLLVSQFTLAADTRAGRRPSFSPAAPPEAARRLFDHFVALARARYAPVASGPFGASMQVELVNDGPVTFWLQVQPGEVA